MKMAKASTEDIEMALDLASALEDIERNQLPAKICGEDDFEWVDTDDARQYARLIEFLQTTLARGSLFRVVFGMAVLCDPKNKLIDPDADTLEHHPESFAAVDMVERYRGLLLWALYHHQGSGSEVGQPIRAALGIGQYARLTPDQIREAKGAATAHQHAVTDDYEEHTQ